MENPDQLDIQSRWWPTKPDYLSLVWGFKPHASGGIKSRHPAIVFEKRESPDGYLLLNVVFGTSQKPGRSWVIHRTEFEIKVGDPDFAIAGLTKTTKFNFADCMYLWFNERWFEDGVLIGNLKGHTGKVSTHWSERISRAFTNAKADVIQGRWPNTPIGSAKFRLYP